MILPTGTILGTLRLTEVLDAYDGPRLVTVKNIVGVSYLGLWVEDVNQSAIWIYVALSEERLNDVTEGKISLRNAFADAEDGFVHRLTVGTDSAANIQTIKTDNIDTSELPPEDDFLHPSANPPNAYSKMPVPARVRQEAKKRHIERLEVNHVNPGRALGQDIVAATWSAWFLCRESSIQANGNKQYSGAPSAVSAAVGSFSVDLSVSQHEAYARAILAWDNYVKEVGSGDVRKRLQKYGIDSVSCESLLRQLLQDELLLRVNLFSERGHGDTIASLEITATVAQSLLNELSGSIPVLSSDRIPQADSLDRVETLVLRLGGVAVDANDDITPRQVSYYKHAAKTLGLITSSDMLTVAGRQFVGASENERLHILRSQFEVSDCGWAWTRWCKKMSLREVNPDTAQDFLLDSVLTLSKSTVGRRASTLRAWHARLFVPPSSGSKLSSSPPAHVKR